MAKQETKMNEPVKKLRCRGVTLTLWENEGEFGPVRSATIQKSYKNKEGQWENSTSFYTRDLQDLRLCIDRALALVVREQE